MKTLLLALILFSGQVSAWYGPGFGPWGPGFGYGWGYGYGMGYMPFIPGPTFSYQQTVIVQEPQPPPPQVIIREPPPQRVIVEEREVIREVCDSECERLRRYFRKH